MWPCEVHIRMLLQEMDSLLSTIGNGAAGLTAASIAYTFFSTATAGVTEPEAIAIQKVQSMRSIKSSPYGVVVLLYKFFRSISFVSCADFPLAPHPHVGGLGALPERGHPQGHRRDAQQEHYRSQWLPADPLGPQYCCR